MNLEKLFSLEGRVALVTGGQRGIGKMITEGFLVQGAKVYITGRKGDQGQAAAEEFGPDCTYICGDISTVEGCKTLAVELADREQHLDILVNNAGVAWGEDYLDFPEAGWDKVMDTNVKGLFFLTQALHSLLKAAATADRPAKVLNVASIDGLSINPWETYSYQASKAAVIHLTRKMASRLIADNIVMSGIAPGPFASTMNKAARDHGEQMAKNVPARRIGNAGDMAAAAVYLASQAGDYVIGTTLPVDGGIVNAMAADSPPAG
ncbi:NAD(P)-dependent dehydrogenase, short-chain alcohol dehydrogenase family [Parasphingorhabdus marina DSM 22363]|uniref:NAD(P)-dependent dehydrogenase, short-chain alcohol dehydrogenase family n=1 Tax=Parasphingorhabdus marina DSM 22363 TaxID=1123272 RepID=A0A1N6D141_9SPHN|nr:SDR family oxidoreductase [Parasphingorhabdus marina]SIN64501.1 NAD(P)-dependent dehydrogenase, short-chain alcohol dehydrogenase family [Parasphingorhabdus marina DSM 22363]